MPRRPFIAQSSTPPPADDILDIVEPAWETSSAPWGLLALLVLLLLVAATAALVLARRFASRGAAPASPEERAFARLDALAPRRAELAPNRYALDLSDALKDFLSEKFGDPVRYETAEEFLQRAASGASVLPDAARHELRAFLEGAEEVKFGRPADAISRLEPLEELARRVVRLGLLVDQAQGDR